VLRQESVVEQYIAVRGGGAVVDSSQRSAGVF
jgi:hypothetical protein